MKKPTSYFTCPSCKKRFTEANESKSFPFCCKRCQMIDLGQWLAEKYVVETPITDEEKEEKNDEQ